MEVRVRNQQAAETSDLINNNNTMDDHLYKDSSKVRMVSGHASASHSACCRVIKGQSSGWVYILIPVVMLAVWMTLCHVTNRDLNITLEERFADKNFRKYLMESQLNEENQIRFEESYVQEAIQLPVGESVNVVLAMPFLDINPLGAAEYITLMELILIHSSVPVTFHVITNVDSIEYVDKVIDRVNKTTENLEFDTEIITLASIMDKMSDEICPNLLKVLASDFCDVLTGQMTPLFFPFLFPELDHAIYVDRNMRFQDDIGLLYNVLDKMRRNQPTPASIAAAPEQTTTYMRAFSTWQRIHPATKLGKAPSKGKPGFNPDLIILDLERLRTSQKYKSYFSEHRIKQLVKNYFYHSAADIPTLGDMLNLIAADWESLVYPLGCHWNRNSKASMDLLEKEYNVCKGAHHVHAWNGNPDPERMAQHSDVRGVSIGKMRIDNELKK